MKMRRPDRKYIFLPYRGVLWSIKPEYLYGSFERGGRIDRRDPSCINDHSRYRERCMDLGDRPRHFTRLDVVRENHCQRGREP